MQSIMYASEPQADKLCVDPHHTLGSLTSFGSVSHDDQVRTFSFGIEAIAHKAWQSLWMTEIIDKCIEAPKPRDGISWGDLTEILVISRLVAPGSRQSVEELFYPNSALRFILDIPLEGVYSERLNQTLEHLEYYQEQILPELSKILVGKFGIDPELAYFDSTDFFMEGDYLNSELVDFGYSRSKVRGRKQVNMELLIDARFGLPIYCRCFNGRRMDMTRVRPLLYQLDELDINNIHLVFDRGYPSRLNRQMILSAGHTYTCGVKLGADTKDIIRTSYPRGANLSSRYVMNGETYYIEEITDRLEEWANREENQKKEGTLIDEKERLFLVFNAKNAENARKKLEERMKDAENEVQSLELNAGRLKSEKSIRKRIHRILRDRCVKSLYEIEVFGTKGSYWVELTRLEDKITDKLASKGFSCLLTRDEELSPGQVFKLYHSKDDVEKANQTIKGPIRARPIYSKKDARIEGHLLICIFAYLLQQLIRTYLEDLEVQISPERFCKVMGRVNLILLAEGENLSFVIPYLTEEQKKILKIYRIISSGGGI